MSGRRRRGNTRRGFPRYTPVAERKARSAAIANRLQKNRDSELQPVTISGRPISRSFWGKAWCTHLEQFSDFSNRLPRGRSYVRNGSVIDLEISKGKVAATVVGTEVYNININISTLPEQRWEFIKEQCAGGIGSALELLQGKISDQVMRTVCDRDNGLFPHPVDIKLDCDCPDWASLCKHLAAVLYGIGARLDESPELLFLLRGVDCEEMISAELAFDTKDNAGCKLKGDLSEIFGVDIDLDLKPVLLSELPEGKSQINNTRATKKNSADMKPISDTSAQHSNKGKLVEQVATKSHLPGSGISVARGLRASHLKKLRRSYSLSVADLSILSGVSEATLHRWENMSGIISTKQNTLSMITKVFDMPYRKAMKRLRRPATRKE